jgi:hypothetical protein
MRKLAITLAVAMLANCLAPAASADEQADRAAAQQIAKNMKVSGQLKDYRVGVKYQDGVAWLLGSVTSAQQKAIAEQIAANTEGVEKVICKLEIETPEPAQDQFVATASAQSSVPQPLASPQQAARRIGGQRQASSNGNTAMPLPYAMAQGNRVQPANYGQYGGPTAGMQPMPMSRAPMGGGRAVNYENPQMPGYAWPSYAAGNNYAALTYPQQYSPSAWPYIGPFYPYPQVPLGWRKVALEWDDGWWFLDFQDQCCH